MNRKPLFDTMRRILGRGFRQHEVDALNEVIEPGICMTPRTAENSVGDCATDANDQDQQPYGKAAAARPAPNKPTAIGPAGIALIKRFEGCARIRPDGLVEAYPDPGTGGAPWTIGWGATGRGVTRDTVWTQAQCDERLEEDLRRYASEVSRALANTPTTQTQFDALVSFHYNTGAIFRATLTKRHRANNTAAAITEFARWNRAGGRIMAGLSRRREAEAALYRA
ncbi:Lysozyme [Alteripontixanthobacter maritimus]|uniref:Lysozyme n=1 Tax=Alteripontixanthobacter maritimus TaxID=2161824 RepID=A0A369Q3I8_9SPHN|nr:lysozyme [Alteripontixanthobacter maritimus]RDC59324.1 Lysozyme [Alteripontixanthobacter maritimus]